MSRGPGGNHVSRGKRDRESRKRDKAEAKTERRARGWEAVAAERENRYNRGPQPGQPIEDFE